ncbi:MAG: selenocysteine-specific translation elongation factor [Vicinamibacterales bacterium]
MTRSLVVGTAGHIDHGKSTLVRALTGIDPDRLKEERERGITIDLGFAHYEADGVTYAFIDVPGHERFVKNMLAGVGGIDCILLVVAADESVKPQTREHFDICRLLRVPAGIIALTKADLVDADTLELVKLETRELAAGTFLEGAAMIAVSARTGQGLDALRAALASLPAIRGRRPDAPVRLPIDRVFSMKGFGTVVTGTLIGGIIREEAELVVLPAERHVKVRGVQVHGRRAAEARAGQRTAINLGGVEVADLTRGDTLAEAGSFQPSRVLDAIVEVLPTAKALKHDARVRLHQGTSELLGRVSIAQGAEIEPGAEAYVRIRLESPAVVTRGDRFILRAYSPPVTIAGGEVLDPDPPRGPIRTAAGRARLARLDPRHHGQDEAAAAFVDERGPAGLARRTLVARAGLTPADADAALDRLAQARRVVDAGPVFVSPRVLDELAGRVVAELTAHHAAQPLSEGAPREELRERLFGRAHGAVFERVLQDLVSAGTIVARDRLALAGHRVSLSPDEARARDAVDRAYRDAALTPPDPASLATTLGLPRAAVDRMVALLVRQKTLIRVEGLLFHTDALARLKSEVTSMKTGGQPARVDVAAFKERYGVSRKFAIPLLEYLDRERVTRRVGDSRVVL